MKSDRDWLWDIIACPECGNAIVPGRDKQEIVCTNSACNYKSRRKGRLFDLLPLELDKFQMAENDFRVKALNKYAHSMRWMSETQHTTFKLLNILTAYLFTSQYFFFRDFFIKRYNLEGRGLEIGGATGHHSGFIKLFYPKTEMITTDVAPINVILAEELAELLGFDTEYFIIANAESLPFLPSSFDFIFSSGMLHHLGDLRRALQKGHSVLKPGGLWYIINELSIGSIPKLFWNSRWGQKGRWARTTGIHENSYTYQEWKDFFKTQNYRIVDMYFHRNPNHKLRSWSRSTYYAFISKLPVTILKLGIPCEICFVLKKD